MGDESKGKGSRIRFAAEDPAIPKPWRALVDGSTGFLYFWNPHTNVTQYERPEYAANPSPNPRLEEESSKHQEKIQVLVDEYNATLRAKKQEFKLEMEKKRKFFDEEIKRKLDAVDKEKKEISYKEEKISKIEQSFKNELEKLEINEEVIKTKLEALKKWEESLKAEEKKLGEEKQKLMTVSQDLVVSRTELESLRAAMKAEQEQIILSKENLELTKVEREEHLKLLRVQAKLKQEIEYWMMKSCSLTKESDALREKVKKFERECEMRDDKRMALQTEVEKIGDDKESFDNWLHNELEKLKNGGLQASADIQELEDDRLRRDTLENIMVQQQSTACAEDSQHIDEESQGASLNADPLVVHSSRKRCHPKLASAPIERLEDVKERFGKSSTKDIIQGVCLGEDIRQGNRPLLPGCSLLDISVTISEAVHRRTP